MLHYVMKLTTPQIAEFREGVYGYYRTHGRSFPWRDPSDAYDVWVSEVMLQQTQADRVVPKYQAFLERFPDVRALAAASLKDVLALWQGLGYNRRAMQLKRAAEIVMEEYGGTVPIEEEALQRLPGIGPYTAAAIAVFAGNRPSIVIETNIRSAYIHHFFGDGEDIADQAILPLIAQTLDADNPREWYQALMDYGAMLKKQGINPSRRSKHYIRQAPFAGSTRQLRGKVLKRVLESPTTAEELAQELTEDAARLDEVLKALEREGLVACRKNHSYAIA